MYFPRDRARVNETSWGPGDLSRPFQYLLPVCALLDAFIKDVHQFMEVSTDLACSR